MPNTVATRSVIINSEQSFLMRQFRIERQFTNKQYAFEQVQFETERKHVEGRHTLWKKHIKLVPDRKHIQENC